MFSKPSTPNNCEKPPLPDDGDEVEEDVRTKSFGCLVSDAVSNTGMQGLPNVGRSSSTFRKVWWGIICMTGICVMCWHIGMAVQKYYTYPTSTTLEYEYKTSLEFPAITICNNNPIRLTELQASDSSLTSFLEDIDTGEDDSQQGNYYGGNYNGGNYGYYSSYYYGNSYSSHYSTGGSSSPASGSYPPSGSTSTLSGASGSSTTTTNPTAATGSSSSGGGSVSSTNTNTGSTTLSSNSASTTTTTTGSPPLSSSSASTTTTTTGNGNGGTTTTTASPTSGTVESPNYPQNYPNNALEVWNLQVPVDKVVKVSFATDFDIEYDHSCSYDYLQVQDGALSSSTVLYKLCGWAMPAPIYSTGNTMRLAFQSDSSVRGAGFMIWWEAADPQYCPSNIATVGGTANGTNCMLPFAYNGQRYSSCITHDRDGDGNSDNAWCGTTENYDHDGLWGNCIITTYAGTATPGSSCYFPFTYSSQTYYDCTADDHTTTWCYSSDNSGQLSSSWGNCNPAACNDSDSTLADAHAAYYGTDNNWNYNYYGANYWGGNYYYNSMDDVWFTGEEDVNFDYVEDFITTASTLPREERIQLGHQLSDMMISCTWQGKVCTLSNFDMFNNYMYGNCYTFNSGRNDTTTLKTSTIGPLYGFSLELYIEQGEYIPGIADSAGMRISIHNQTTMPFPEDFGISLKPGTKTSLGLTRKEMYRASKPHGSCKDYTEYENLMKNAFLGDIETVGYSVPACRKTCYQKALLINCSCYDYEVPASDDLECFKGLGDDVNITAMPPCDDDDTYKEKETCIKKVKTAFVSNSLGCTDQCQMPCFESQFPYEVSYSQWPSEASEAKVLQQLAASDEYFMEILYRANYDDVWKKQYIQNNFLKLEVFFSDMNYEVMKTTAAYDAISLISDLGGQGGLWLGVSIVAFFELFELIMDLVILLVKHVICKKPLPKTKKVVKSANALSAVNAFKMVKSPEIASNKGNPSPPVADNNAANNVNAANMKRTMLLKRALAQKPSGVTSVQQNVPLPARSPPPSFETATHGQILSHADGTMLQDV